MKIVSFIPIKLNNQRLPGKNTKILDGRPLCDYLFETISDIDIIDEKYVYCSEEKIIPYIEPYVNKGLIYKKRDKSLDENEVKGLEIIERFVTEVESDIYVLAHVTQPFIKKQSIEKAIKMVVENGYDSSFSAIALQDYLWLDGKPLNYNLKDIVRTQDLEKVYMETGAFFVFKREVFKKLGQRIGDNPYICETSQFEAIDIDTIEDFEFAQAVAPYIRTKGDIYEKY